MRITRKNKIKRLFNFGEQEKGFFNGKKIRFLPPPQTLTKRFFYNLPIKTGKSYI